MSSAHTLPLAGKIAIVTGASRGIGAAISLELAKRGAKVAITFVSPSSAKLADQVMESINNLGNGAAAIKIQADMRSLESPKQIVDETVAAFGTSIDILVNNAGMEYSSALTDITLEGYKSVLDLNVRSVIFMTQAVVPHLRSPGRIISIGSVLGSLGFPNSSVYSATKAAVEALSRGWASELGGSGHTVNVVSPALTETDMMQRFAGGPDSEQTVQLQKMMTPLEHRLGKPEDIALAVALIADPASRWITGQTIQAGGGIYMGRFTLRYVLMAPWLWQEVKDADGQFGLLRLSQRQSFGIHSSVLASAIAAKKSISVKTRSASQVARSLIDYVHRRLIA